MERFKNVIFKQREEINDKIAEMFGLLKELTTIQTPKKVLIREETRHPTAKNVNSISLIRMEEEKSIENNKATDKSMAEPSKYDEQEPPKEVDKTNEGGRRADDEPVKGAKENVTKNEEEEPAGVSSSHPVGYYLKHIINEKLIEGLVENQRFNDSLSATRAGKMKQKTYDLLPTKAMIKFDKGTITLKYGKSKISFHMIPEPYSRIEKGIKNDIQPIALTMTINRILQEVTNRIACRNSFQENECEIFTEAGDSVRIIPDDVRLYLMRRSLEVLREFPNDDSWMTILPVIASLRWILEEIHVTWAHLENKWTRLRLYTKSLEEIIIQTVETVSPSFETASELDQDGVRSITMAPEYGMVFPYGCKAEIWVTKGLMDIAKGNVLGTDIVRDQSGNTLRMLEEGGYLAKGTLGRVSSKTKVSGGYKRRSSHIVIAKLVVAASAYFIWQERNWRLFKKTKRTVNQVIECIKSAVRLKLLSCSFKRSSEGVRYDRMWDLPDTIFKC
ncbi:hypothetical protein Tco_0977819 [Tanacetum coccineum]|uniref:Uncharacterized protein n=1 Tax=Tanacetum coccineum TaxID=301880 RepID=A0ABQ5ELD2_9ASTR